MPWEDSFVAIDTETTGFDSQARVIEIAAVTFIDGEVARIWECLLRPTEVDWESSGVQKALEVNNIKVADLADKPSFGDILPDLLLELSNPVWVAHNAEFDMRMLQQELARLNRPDVQLPEAVFLCTLQLSRTLDAKEKGHRLPDVAPRWNVPQEGQAHRAASDAITCGRILRAMSHNLPGELSHVYEHQKEAARKWGQRRG